MTRCVWLSLQLEAQAGLEEQAALRNPQRVRGAQLEPAGLRSPQRVGAREWAVPAEQEARGMAVLRAVAEGRPLPWELAVARSRQAAGSHQEANLEFHREESRHRLAENQGASHRVVELQLCLLPCLAL